MIDINDIKPQWVKFKHKENVGTLAKRELMKTYGSEEEIKDEYEWEEGELFALVDTMYNGSHGSINQTCYLIKSDNTKELNTYPCQDYLVEFGFNAK